MALSNSSNKRQLAKVMAASLLCFVLLKNFEEFEPFPYQDAAGIWTVGYGHQIRPGEDFSEGISREEAEELLKKDVDNHQRAVQRYVQVPLTQGQYDALCSFTFNLGVGTLKDSGMLKQLNKGNYDEALRRLQMYVNATDPETGQKMKLRGLVARRTAERDLWEGNYNPNTRYK